MKVDWKVGAKEEKRNDEWRPDDAEIPFEWRKSIFRVLCLIARLMPDPSRMVQRYGDNVTVLKNKNKHVEPVHCGHIVETRGANTGVLVSGK